MLTNLKTRCNGKIQRKINAQIKMGEFGENTKN